MIWDRDNHENEDNAKRINLPTYDGVATEWGISERKKINQHESMEAHTDEVTKTGKSITKAKNVRRREGEATT